MKGKPSAVFYRNVKVVLSALQVQCSLICCYLAELLISSHKVFFIGHNNFMLAIRCFTYSTTQTHSLSDIFAALTKIGRINVLRVFFKSFDEINTVTQMCISKNGTASMTQEAQNYL